MVVDEDDGCGRKIERTFNDFTRIDRRVIDRAALLDLIGNQRIALVEEENSELFTRFIGHGCVTVFHHR